MKKINVYILILLCLFIGAEILWIANDGKEEYPDIVSQLETVEINDSEGTRLRFENIAIQGRNYSQLICQIKNNKARIISLKTKEDTLVIPNSLGKYPVKVIGGDWTEIPEVVEYARTKQMTPPLGVAAWMADGKKYKKIVIEEGICTVYAESFYGIRGDVLEFPQSLLLLGALSFAESEVDEVIVKNQDVYSDWGVFLNTKHQNKFRQTKPENRSDSTFSEPEDGETYKPLSIGIDTNGESDFVVSGDINGYNMDIGGWEYEK